MLKVTLTLGSRTRCLTGAELVAALGSKPSIARLARLVLDAEGSAIPRNENEASERTNVSVQNNSSNAFGNVRSLSSGASTEARAGHLADVLGDRRSIAWYRLVLRDVPESIVSDALARVLQVPEENIRRSRAALFTSIVRPHLASYAHAPSAPS